MVRPPFVEGIKACRHDGTVHPWQPVTPESSRGLTPTAPWPHCPPILWPTCDPLGRQLGACGGPNARPPRGS